PTRASLRERFVKYTPASMLWFDDVRYQRPFWDGSLPPREVPAGPDGRVPGYRPVLPAQEAESFPPTGYSSFPVLSCGSGNRCSKDTEIPGSGSPGPQYRNPLREYRQESPGRSSENCQIRSRPAPGSADPASSPWRLPLKKLPQGTA